MGMLNVTPDSFSDGGRFVGRDAALRQAETDGRWRGDPRHRRRVDAARGGRRVSEQQELDRVVPVIEAIRAAVDVPVSIDTSKPGVMRAAMAAGATMINDIRALRGDGALEAAVELQLPVCLMHMQGEPRTMQQKPDIRMLWPRSHSSWMSAWQCALRPGCGGHDHCRSGFWIRQDCLPQYRVAGESATIAGIGRPILVGVSRKSTLGQFTGRDVDERLPASIAAAVIAVIEGAKIVRAHDVRETVDALRVARRSWTGTGAMSKKHFGTDGVRGTVGKDPMTADFAMRLASAAAQVLVPAGGTVLIGKDTRLSGYMFESALEAGFVAAGADVLLIGPLPTPGIAHLTQEFSADLGVVISASHNLYFDNGIKFFDGSGSKLTDEVEEAIEASLDKAAITVESQSLGKAQRIDSALVRYEKFCASTLPDGLDLDGLKVVFDAANGAGYKVGPRTLANLNAEVIPIGCSPNGRNINDGCGSTRPELLQLTVPAVAADIGVALDGDGDRVVLVDEAGELVDGDQILYVLATAWQDEGRLHGPVVGTVMSNLGLEQRAAGAEYRIPARPCRRSLRARGPQRGRRRDRRRDVGSHDRTRPDHHRGRAHHRPAGSGRHEADGQEAVGTGGGMSKYPQTMLNVRTEQRMDPDESPQIREAVKRSAR